MAPAARSPEDFATVFARERDAAVRLAYLLTSDPDVAQDVVAEAFTKVYVAWRRGGVANLGGYARRAVVHEAQSSLRRRYRSRGRAARHDGDDRGVVLHDQAAADRDELWQAVVRLPERQRACVVLRFYEDLPDREIADLLGISEGTVRSNIARALNRLDQLVASGTARTDRGGRA